VRNATVAVLVTATAPAGVLMLLGAGFAAAAAGHDAAGPGSPGAEQAPSAEAHAVPGGGGCTVTDPSGTGGCVTPALAGLMRQVEQAFGHLPVACWSARDGDPYSDHPKGRACDYTIGRIGTYPDADHVAHGWTLATWLRTNAQPLHVAYVIWQGRIWSRVHDAQGWRPYTGGGHYSTSGPTNGHYDHVHVSTLD